MPYKSYYLDVENHLHRELSEEETKEAFESRKGLLWLDFNNTSPEDGEFLSDVFNFHPLTLEDCISNAIHAPKIDHYADHLFLILRGINYTRESEVVETAELDVFVGSHFVVSTHNVFLYSIESVSNLVDTDGGPMKQGASFLAHALADALVNNIAPTIDSLIDRMEIIEVEALSNPNETILQAIVAMKKSNLALRHSLSPQLDVLSQLSQSEFPLINAEARTYFRETYDHMIRLVSHNEGLRERGDTALATYMSAMANKQNEVMKVLSITATIFLPLSLLAGIYGMNFEYMPETKWPWGYFAVLGIMATVIGGVSWMFWARKWVATGSRRLSKFVPVDSARAKLSTYVGPVTRLPLRAAGSVSTRSANRPR